MIAMENPSTLPAAPVVWIIRVVLKGYTLSFSSLPTASARRRCQGARPEYNDRRRKRHRVLWLRGTVGARLPCPTEGAASSAPTQRRADSI